MIISRESDYAIRILRVVADGEKHVVKDMCESEKIPKQFAYKIIDKLRDAGYVNCLRGKHGGCELGCDLHEITLYDLLKVIDNQCYLNACLQPGYECPWQEAHPEACRVHQKLSGLQFKVDDTLQSLDLYSVMFD